MALLQWSDRYSVGIKTFDLQHQQLIKLLNDLHDAMMKGKGSEILGSILDSLVNYTKTHFCAEEEVMSNYAYEDFLNHKNEHTKLKDKVIEFQTKFRNGQAVLSVPLLQFLKDWLTHHILETDKNYGPFLKEQGVS
ncbi:MAG: bacteriohemerythrin [bacterium]